MNSLNHRRSPAVGRRVMLGGALAALAAPGLIPTGLRAQEAARGTGRDAGGEPFSFEALTEAARARAAEPYAPPEPVGGFVAELGYDEYRSIRFEPDRARWSESDARFHLMAFHLGWLFEEPVTVNEIVDGRSRPMTFTTEDFDYGTLEVEPEALPGVSGFRLHAPLNRPDVWDEVIAFQGASYFRALGRGNAYGLSARGLGIGTATGEPEEFPWFSAFHVVRPEPGERTATVYADLDGESVAGAYRFVIAPGQDTVVEVTARLFFRRAVDHLGVAPLTSMFLYDDTNRARFDDFRPRVHDSDGLRIRSADGDVLWRALQNPPRLATSYFREDGLRSFGLHQRDRRFVDFQDAGAHYHERPAVDVEPIGDWGPGAVRLVEIPSDLEINDNVVAYWLPEGAVAEGEAREYAYRLRWGMLEPDPQGSLAFVSSTKAGIGGVSGVENDGGTRKFVVDFRGGRLAALPPDAEVEAQVTVGRGEIASRALSKVEGEDIWRLAVDVEPRSDSTVEMLAYVEGYGERLSETWLHQWIPTR